MRAQALTEAKQRVRQAETGVISTLSHTLRGYPFGSVSPFISCSEGKLYFYISEIAQHAKNLNLDSRMSLTVFNQAQQGDQNAQGRVTLVGDATPMENDEACAMLKKYLLRFPEAASYQQAHDFKLWQMEIKRVRYIAGFGKIFWLEQAEWQADPAPWDEQSESHMVEHMNEDHKDAMSLILSQHHGITAHSPLMSGVVTDGVYIQSHGKNHFVPFADICRNAGDVRTALVNLTRQAREAA